MSGITGHQELTQALRRSLGDAIKASLPGALHAGSQVMADEISLRAAEKDPELASAVLIDIEMDAIADGRRSACRF